jgi:hypothetical protein
MRLAIPLALLLAGCGGGSSTSAVPARAVALAAMDTVLATGRRAHLELDAELLAAGVADTLVSLADGAVTLQPKDSMRAMFRKYFTGAHYHHWDDIAPPRIQLSDDNTMAWVSRIVCVDREEPAPEGGRRRRVFVSGYSATFLWRDGGWRMTTVTSTFLPEAPRTCPPGARP